MGGIFCLISLKKENVVDTVAKRLKFLEYRGFNGSGLAILINNHIEIYKDVLRIDELYKKYNLSNISSYIAIGHTRYATHGKPSSVNTQPHTDCSKTIVVVGDGAIANYEILRDEILVKNHNVVSKCDFEVVAHLVEEKTKQQKQEQNFKKIFAEVVENIDGFYSLAMLNSENRLMALFSHGPTLYVGLSKDVIAISSGLNAMHNIVEKIFKLDYNEIIFIDVDSGRIESTSTSIDIDRRFFNIVIDSKNLDKDGYSHHMLREIYEIPHSLQRTIYSIQNKYLSLAAKLVSDSEKLFVIGNGSSLHAAYVGSYYLSEIAGLSPIVVSAAEFPLYYVDVVSPGTVVIAISQSGESGDVISSVYEAKLRGATILGLSNYIGSRLTNMSNLYLPIGAGPELAIPATKTFTSSLLLFYMLALASGKHLGRIQESDVRLALDSVKSLSIDLQDRINIVEYFAENLAKHLFRCRNGYVVSRGLTYPLALEGALKFKEVAYIHAEGVEAGEYKHGPQVLLDEDFFVLFIMPVERIALEASYGLIKTALERKTSVGVIGLDYDEKLRTLDENIPRIIMPTVSRHLAPIVLTIPLYLTIYKLATLLNREIDTPRYLSKTIQ